MLGLYLPSPVQTPRTRSSIVHISLQKLGDFAYTSPQSVLKPRKYAPKISENPYFAIDYFTPSGDKAEKFNSGAQPGSFRYETTSVGLQMYAVYWFWRAQLNYHRPLVALPA